MEKLKNDQNKITASLFIVYIIVLTWMILFKMQFTFQDLRHFTVFRRVNFIPFAGSAVIGNQIDLSEIIFNVLVFIPFGMYISMLKPNWSILRKIVPIAGVSLVFEVLQFIFKVGGSDITDLMGNTFGGIIGVGVYFGLSKLFRTKTTTILNVLAIIGTICIFVLMLLFIIGVIRYGNDSL